MNIKKHLTLFAIIILLLFVLSGCNVHIHNYCDVTCTEPQTCSKCGKSKGDALGHNYSIATCTEASKCGNCGKIKGHALGHNYSVATCTEASKCSNCGETLGRELGHSFSDATCNYPQICIRCDETAGAPLGHTYSTATCLSPQKCNLCENTQGTPLGHKYVNNICIRCAERDPKSIPAKLKDLYLIQKGRWYSYVEGIYKDSYGNTYSGAHNYYYIGFNNNGADDGLYSIHNLDKQYTIFSGTIVSGALHRQSVSIEIYIDDVLAFSRNNITIETGQIDFSLNVTNSQKLKIVISGGERSGDQIDIAIVNSELKKQQNIS